MEFFLFSGNVANCNMDGYFKCSTCGNEDLRKIGHKNGKPYCRACINFSGQKIQTAKTPRASSLHLTYNLTKMQTKISEQILENYKDGVDTLVDAVTGAGKTELMFRVIDYALNHGQKIGFAAPRREVVIEIASRFKYNFPKNEIVAVYGNHTEKLDGDIVCLTAHQLYRYENFFDLLIFDEVDAFPYQGNEVLMAFFKKSTKGHHILLSATPSKEIISAYGKNNRKIVSLNVRYHGYPLPVPKIIILPKIIDFFYLIFKLKQLINNGKRVFVFAPTIERCGLLYRLVKPFVKNGGFVHSKLKQKEEEIRKIKNNEIEYLITTSVLERGVTYKDLQVIVFEADHNIFTSETLIQISGRVGRKKDSPTGEVILIAKRKTSEILRCISEIERKNRDLQDLF